MLRYNFQTLVLNPISYAYVHSSHTPNSTIYTASHILFNCMHINVQVHNRLTHETTIFHDT